MPSVFVIPASSNSTLCPPSKIPPPSQQLASLKSSILSATSSAQQSEIKAWEEELQACEHTLMLEQYGRDVVGEGYTGKSKKGKRGGARGADLVRFAFRCHHVLSLQSPDNEIPGSTNFPTPATIVPPNCTQCSLSSNLWLCLTCGSVNCGRKQIGGADGNGHALKHYNETGHGVGVKLGTITVEGGGGEC